MVKIEYINTSKLILSDKNPRKIDDKDFAILCDSIVKNHDYFETRPILCNKDMEVFAGNMRLRAAIKVGLDKVPTAIMDIPKERQRELLIRDNVQNGQWDEELLPSLFDNAELEEWGVDMSQFGVWDLDPTEIDDVIPEEVPAIAKLGDLYQLGDHRVLCGDSTSPEAYLALMEGKKADMVFTDPPYNVDYTGGGSYANHGTAPRKAIANDKMSTENFYKFLRSVMDNLVANVQGAFYICMSSSELHNLWKAFTDAGGHWQTYIIWAKDLFTLSRADYQHQMEPILYGVDIEASLVKESDSEPIMYGWTQHEWYGGRKQGNVWHIDRPKKSELHPTMKPVMLVCKAMVNSSKAGQIVLDPFLGSGTTIIACEKGKRRCFGMEIDPHYLDVCIKRWEDFTGKKAIKL